MNVHKERIVGDVSITWLWYFEQIIDKHPDSRWIALKRDKETLVRSWVIRSYDKNYWTDPKSKHWREEEIQGSLYEYFPKYDLPKIQAVAQFYDDYYLIVDGLCTFYPHNVICLETEYALNTEDGQHEILEFIGVPLKDRRIHTGMKLNQIDGRDSMMFAEELPCEVGQCRKCGKPGTVVVKSATGTLSYFSCMDHVEDLLEEGSHMWDLIEKRNRVELYELFKEHRRNDATQRQTAKKCG